MFGNHRRVGSVSRVVRTKEHATTGQRRRSSRARWCNLNDMQDTCKQPSLSSLQHEKQTKHWSGHIAKQVGVRGVEPERDYEIPACGVCGDLPLAGFLSSSFTARRTSHTENKSRQIDLELI